MLTIKDNNSNTSIVDAPLDIDTNIIILNAALDNNKPNNNTASNKDKEEVNKDSNLIKKAKELLVENSKLKEY